VRSLYKFKNNIFIDKSELHFLSNLYVIFYKIIMSDILNRLQHVYWSLVHFCNNFFNIFKVEGFFRRWSCVWAIYCYTYIM